MIPQSNASSVRGNLECLYQIVALWGMPLRWFFTAVVSEREVLAWNQLAFCFNTTGTDKRSASTAS